MFAVIKTGGKQYRVKKGDVIDVELLQGEPGETVEFCEVLCIGDGDKTKVGSPSVAGFSVMGELVEMVAGPKIVSMKYTVRQRSTRKTFGHRQKYSRVKITDIKG